MSIKIVTDSTSDIPLQLQKELDITVIPLYINLNGRSYQDTVDLTRTEFYEQLPTANPHPTTAAPSPGQFAKAYDDLADQGATAIFSIHIAGSLAQFIALLRRLHNNTLVFQFMLLILVIYHLVRV